MAEIQPIRDLEGAKVDTSKPNSLDAFDEIYGQGSALQVLKGTYEVPPEPEGPSMFEQAKNAFTNTVSAIGDMSLDDFIEGSVDTLQGIGRGIISAPTELVETITNINTMGTEQANSSVRSSTTRNNVLENDGKPPMSPEEEAEFH